MAIVSKGGGGGGSGERSTPAGTDQPLTNLPPSTGPVCGRGAEMRRVAEVFSGGDRQEGPGTVELTGPRGIGATTVALELARRVGRRFPGGAWYVPLSMGVDEAWADLAASRGVQRTTNLAQTAKAARDAFSTGPRALVVLDGALSKEDLETSLPPREGDAADVFVVSEEPSGLIPDVVEISAAPPRAPRRIAHSVLRMRDGESADAPAVRSLDGLGLTASLAARAAVAYDGHQGPISVPDCRLAVMRLMPLVARNAMALELMLLCSVAHPVRIPVDALFESVTHLRAGRGEPPKPEDVGTGIMWLARLGLVNPDDETRISMHPAVQEVARGMAATPADLEMAASALAHGLQAEAESAVGDDGVEIRRAALHQLRHVLPRLRGDAHDVVAATLAKVEAALGIGA